MAQWVIDGVLLRDGSANVANLKVGQTVSPATDGVTTVFTISEAYTANSLSVYRSGERVFAFTETNPNAGTFTMTVAPLTAETLRVDYLQQ